MCFYVNPEPSMSEKTLCMVMRINIDCNSCCRKLRRIILNMKAIETHLIEKEHYIVTVCGRFIPSDVAIKIRKKMNRRVEILEIQEMETAEDPPPEPPHDQEEQTIGPKFPSFANGTHNSIFPSLENDNRRPMYPYPYLVNECRSFSSSRPDYTVTCFPRNFDDMAESFWHYGFEYSRNTDSAFYA